MQELRAYPCEGQDFIETGLQSAPIRTRNGALYVLEAWVGAKGEALLSLLPQFCALLSRLKEKEPDDTVRSRMEKLLSGATAFDQAIHAESDSMQ